jgi:putative SOS response-associated peptidase YedK
MCNRIRGLKEWSEIPRSLARSFINFEYNPNVAPTEQVPAFLAERGKPLATRLARFGINLASNGGNRRPPLLNARTDSLRRGSFKTMLANKRCVIPAEGFYEWREEHGKKQPYFFARKDGKPVMFAGIWDYSDVKGEAVPSFAILTDGPNECDLWCDNRLGRIRFPLIGLKGQPIRPGPAPQRLGRCRKPSRPIAGAHWKGCLATRTAVTICRRCPHRSS